MIKTTTIIAMIGALTLGGASQARAQAGQTPSESPWIASISLGGQVQSRTLTTNNTINVFGEDGAVAANQVIGKGMVFDAAASYRLGRKLAVAIGVSTFSGKGDAAAIASIPDRLRFGAFTNVPLTATGLKQSDIAYNFQAVWPITLSNRIDLAVFGGPSIIRVKQDIASVSVNTTTGVASTTSETQSKTTGKAGSAGVDVRYKLTSRFAAGVLLRYLGGEVDLPAAPKMKVGGVQVAGGVRFHF
jgi:hypothetical protein